MSTLQDTLGNLTSSNLRKISLQLVLLEPDNRTAYAPPSPDSEFWTIDFGPVHGVITSPHFSSLRDVKLELARNYGAYPLTTDVGLGDEEVERRLRFIVLQPWESRGILSVRYEDWNHRQPNESKTDHALVDPC